MQPRWKSLAVACAVAFAVGASGFLISRVAARPRSLRLGEPVDGPAPIGVAEALAVPVADAPTPLVVRGRISAVCLSGGCWLVLQEVGDHAVAELRVDVGGDYVVEAAATGVAARALGRLADIDGERRLRATGLVIGEAAR